NPYIEATLECFLRGFANRVASANIIINRLVESVLQCCRGFTLVCYQIIDPYYLTMKYFVVCVIRHGAVIALVCQYIFHSLCPNFFNNVIASSIAYRFMICCGCGLCKLMIFLLSSTNFLREPPVLPVFSSVKPKYTITLTNSSQVKSFGTPAKRLTIFSERLNYLHI